MIDSSFLGGVSGLREEVKLALKRLPAHFIDGQWIESDTSIPVIDPATGTAVATIARGGAADIDDAVNAAARAFKSREWKSIGPLGRERLLLSLADLIEANAEVIDRKSTRLNSS